MTTIDQASELLRKVGREAAVQSYWEGWGEEPDAFGESYLTRLSDAVLAALFEACEAREELGVRFTFPDGLYNDCWLNDQAAIDRAVAHPGTDMVATPLRRLVITTPPLSSTDEEGAR